ncbi:MAG: histidine phosphatase family protein [Betaproteobacteria bacterium RIFCSPLOWO2_02_FULL_66_14]|nr:MAG: histidine phosphatase family protein [Betaproteobacteria bacterium RIFCSPLOWO2_02_FULL_66_14]
MQLILWRHAQAEDGGRDLERELTAKGRRQAARVAAWLRRRLPEKFRVLSSPAIRAQQTAAALGGEVAIVDGLAPGASAAEVLECSGWPDVEDTLTVVVGHQPTLGELAAQLVSGRAAEWSVRKGGLWWLEHRARGAHGETVVRAVISPDLL